MNAAFTPRSRATAYPSRVMKGVFASLGWVLVGVVVLAAGPMPAGAADVPQKVDQEHARAARARGEVLSLARILSLVEHDFSGRVIEVELERDDGELLYEIELLLADGRVIELEFDARTGALVKIEGARLETAFKPRPAAGAAPR